MKVWWSSKKYRILCCVYVRASSLSHSLSLSKPSDYNISTHCFFLILFQDPSNTWEGYESLVVQQYSTLCVSVCFSVPPSSSLLSPLLPPSPSLLLSPSPSTSLLLSLPSSFSLFPLPLRSIPLSLSLFLSPSPSPSTYCENTVRHWFWTWMHIIMVLTFFTYMLITTK